MKNLIDAHENQVKKISVLNKIIIRQSVLFYAEACRHMNEVLHEPLKCESFVIEWYEKVVDVLNKENRQEMKRHLRAQDINVENCDNACIRQWNLSTMQMRKTSKEEKVNETRRFLATK